MENPLTSHLWLSDPFLDLRAVCGDHLVLVDFHQCQFGLRLPGSKANQFCKKAARIATNMATLSKLSRFCPGVSAAHAHDVAWGAVKVRRKWLSKATAAGQYPDQLCHEWSLLAAAAIGHRFWKGPCPWRGHSIWWRHDPRVIPGGLAHHEDVLAETFASGSHVFSIGLDGGKQWWLEIGGTMSSSRENCCASSSTGPRRTNELFGRRGTPFWQSGLRIIC